MIKRLLILTLIISLMGGCSIFRRQSSAQAYFISATEQTRELRYIEQKDELTRLDIAYLFAIFVPSPVKVDYKEIPLDMKMQLYPHLAYAAVKRDIMTIFPDSTFKPFEKVQKYQLAIFFTRYINSMDPFFDAGLQNKPIADVSEVFFAYKPVNTVVSRDIMPLQNGKFYPFAYISGKEAVEMFYRLNRYYY